MDDAQDSSLRSASGRIFFCPALRKTNAPWNMEYLCLPGIPQHIIQTGNNRQIYFVSNDDFSVYFQRQVKFSLQVQSNNLFLQ